VKDIRACGVRGGIVPIMRCGEG